jgi:hypothetical protein
MKALSNELNKMNILMMILYEILVANSPIRLPHHEQVSCMM